MTTSRLSACAVFLAVLVVLAGARSALFGRPMGALVAEFSPEDVGENDAILEVPPPSFEGKAFVRGPDGSWIPIEPPVPLEPEIPVPAPESQPPLGDVFFADGSENALAINVSDPDNLVGVINQGYLNSASVRTSADGNVSWTTRTFPNGGGTYTGSPFDPWANEGNAAGELFATLIRRDTGSSNTHSVTARSTNGGVSWSLFFERSKNVFQDREMVDIDRTNFLGGGTGTTHDGKVYLCYDDFGVNGAGYVGSFLQVVSSGGSALTELTISTLASFNGSKLQPVAGTTDGQVYLMGVGVSGGGATTHLMFHEVTGAGSGLTLNKSTFNFPTTGQQLGGSGRWGVNGHRINSQMFMDIDKTSGPRRGDLYVISDRNPNPFNAALDQGDVYLSISTDGASSWSHALLPGLASGKTQFFSMIDVDDNGWLHVSYYQNETGSTNNGVLNASSANVYYTVSRDGGSTWDPHIQVNSGTNTLDYMDPPPNLAAQNYYLIGDYCQVKATGTAAATRAYVFWTGYDKDRSDTFLNDKRDRAICTTITNAGCGDGTCDSSEICTCPLDCPTPPTNEFISVTCFDGLDNDCDGFTDCTDNDCICEQNCNPVGCGNGVCGDPPGESSCNCVCDCGPAPGSEVACSDGLDNDCDGLVDCGDPNCSGIPPCATVFCPDGICHPSELCTCFIDCGPPRLEGTAFGNCADGLDNDCDSCTDAADSGCGGTETNCTDGVDNNCDGLTDCSDSSCASNPACEACCQSGGTCVEATASACIVQGGTNQGAGTDCLGSVACCTPTGCADMDDVCCASAGVSLGGGSTCGTLPSTESACADGVDNDCDGSIDCTDGDCASSSSCASPPTLAGFPHAHRKNRYLSFVPNNPGGAVAFRVELTHQACSTSKVCCGGGDASNDGTDCVSNADCTAPLSPGVCQPRKCLDAGDCKVCAGGSRVGLSCRINSDCPSSTCVVSGQTCDTVGSPTVIGWVGDPILQSGGDFQSLLAASMPATRNWTEPVIHLTGFDVAPVQSYAIRATADGATFSNPLVIGTIEKPAGKDWADVVGGFTFTCSSDGVTPCTAATVGADCPPGDACGAWSPPNGFVNVDDVVSFIKFVSTGSVGPHITDIDLGGSVPNWIANATDLQLILQGFGGKAYPPSSFPPGSPTSCP